MPCTRFSTPPVSCRRIPLASRRVKAAHLPRVEAIRAQVEVLGNEAFQVGGGHVDQGLQTPPALHPGSTPPDVQALGRCRKPPMLWLRLLADCLGHNLADAGLHELPARHGPAGFVGWSVDVAQDDLAPRRRRQDPGGGTEGGVSRMLAS